MIYLLVIKLIIKLLYLLALVIPAGIASIQGGQFEVAASSICFLPDGVIVAEPSDCQDGEVHLLGLYVNLGVHNAGSYGTNNYLNTSYYSQQLAFIANYDRSGFSTSSEHKPAFAGDFSVGPYVEG